MYISYCFLSPPFFFVSKVCTSPQGAVAPTLGTTALKNEWKAKADFRGSKSEKGLVHKKLHGEAKDADVLEKIGLQQK